MNFHIDSFLTLAAALVYFTSRQKAGYVEKLEMFNLCSRNLPSSRMFAVTGVARAMSTLGIATFCVGQTLFGVSVPKIDPSGGSSA